MTQLSELPPLPYKQWFPWLALFRAGGLAVGWPQLGISFVAVLVFWAGTSLLGWMFPRETPAVFSSRLPGFTSICSLVDVDANKLLPESPQDFEDSTPLLMPWRSVATSLSPLIWTHDKWSGISNQQPHNVWGHVANLTFAVMVWSLFGTALCRAAALQFARDRGESFPQVVRYAIGRWLSTMGAPSIPGGAILFVLTVLVVAGWLARLPVVGGSMLSVLSPVWFLAGMVIAFFALVVLCGWPLMIAAMAIEDCDAFGALSRTYSFLAGRPSYALWNALVSAVHGVALVAVVGAVFSLALLAESKPIAANVGDVDRWRAVVSGSHLTAQFLLAVFAVSLFWSLVTVNYLLLREAVDRKPMDVIAPGVDEIQMRASLPVVGIPATDYRPGDRDGRPMEAETVAPAT